MTYSDMLHAWSVIERLAQNHGVTPAEVREDIKEAIARLWELEENDDAKPLHNEFPNGIPSVEAAIIFFVRLTKEGLGL